MVVCRVMPRLEWVLTMLRSSPLPWSAVPAGRLGHCAVVMVKVTGVCVVTAPLAFRPAALPAFGPLPAATALFGALLASAAARSATQIPALVFVILLHVVSSRMKAGSDPLRQSSGPG